MKVGTKPAIQEEVPWSDSLTTYDKQHHTLYLRFLDAAADDASYEEMAQEILGIDPVQEPERARKAARSHLDRANWMVTTGYKEFGEWAAAPALLSSRVVQASSDHSAFVHYNSARS